MTVTSDLADIDADTTKTPEEKRVAKLLVRATAFRDNAQGNVGRNVRLPDGRRITIHSVTLADGGVKVVYTWQGGTQKDVVVVNPPYRVQVGTGPQATYPEDLVAAGLAILARLP